MASEVLCAALLHKTLSIEIEAHEILSVVVVRSLFALVKFLKI